MERGRGLGTELWLARAGSAAELASRLRAFEGIVLGLVLYPPGGEEQRWAEAFAAASGATLEHAPELAPAARESAAELAARAWPVLEEALGRGLTSVLVVLSREVLLASVAQALALSHEGVAALRVDPGRLVLLRDEPGGISLRRSNVLAPETNPGTALPDGGRARAR